jgi:cell wall-associated NlpC family hydrolase
VEVDQRKDGGTWVRLGAYRMEESDRYSIQVSGRSKADGRIVADAVMVVAGTQAAPQDPNDSATGGGGGTPVIGGDVVASEVIERARMHLGTTYMHSPPMPCQAYQSEDCSCFTSLVFSKWVSMPDNPIDQWQFGHYVEKSDLRPGDLVFFKEAGPDQPITHVAIYSGGGNIIDASAYWGHVVEKPMKYVDGYYGARRLIETTPEANGPARATLRPRGPNRRPQDLTLRHATGGQLRRQVRPGHRHRQGPLRARPRPRPLARRRTKARNVEPGRGAGTSQNRVGKRRQASGFRFCGAMPGPLNGGALRPRRTGGPPTAKTITIEPDSCRR